MTTVIQDIIDDLLKIDVQDPEVFGDLISKYLFKEGESALVINRQKPYLLVRNTATDLFVRSKILLLFELMSVIESLQKSHDVLIITGDVDPICVYYEGKKYINNITHNLYKLSDNNLVLAIESDDNISINKGYSKLLSKVIELTSLQMEFAKYLSSVILPTLGLSKFKENGYLDDDVFLNIRSLRISRISVIIAIILALLSPIISVVLNNTITYSTINETQFNQILEAIEANKVIHYYTNSIE